MFYAIVAVSILVPCAIYITILCWDANQQVKLTPKKTMFMCDKHGPLPESSTVVLMEGMDYTTSEGVERRGDIRQCVLCFEEAVKRAKVKS